MSSGPFAEKLSSVINLEKLCEVGKQLKSSPAGLDPDLLTTIQFAISFHHSGLTIEERDIIENSFRAGILKVLVATTTLSSGVNLPARRVIIRTFGFPPKYLDYQTYKQMAGRAGRKNVDTSGESILMCRQDELTNVRLMFSRGLRPVQSCLMKSLTCLRRAILEVIANGFIQRLHQAKEYLYGTLMYQELLSDTLSSSSQHNQSVDDDISQQIDKSFTTELNSILSSSDYRKLLYQSLNWLKKLKAIAIEKVPGVKDRILKVTPLGRAFISSSLGPIDGFTAYKELSKARKAMSLESDLHLVYLITPVNIDTGNDISWQNFSEMFSKLNDEDLNVAKLIGINHSYIFRRMSGILKLTETRLNMEPIYRRFFVALILNQLIQERSLQDLVTISGFNKGQLQTFQQRAALYSGMVTSFCNRLGWVHLERLFAAFQWRLCFGVSQELIDLLRLEPLLNAQRARALFSGGITSVIEVARMKKNNLVRLLQQSKQFKDTPNPENNQGSYSTTKREKSDPDLIVLEDGRVIDEYEASDLLIDRAKELISMDLAAEYGLELAVDRRVTTANSPAVSVATTQPEEEEGSLYSPITFKGDTMEPKRTTSPLELPQTSGGNNGSPENNRIPSVDDSKLCPPHYSSDENKTPGKFSAIIVDGDQYKFSLLDQDLDPFDDEQSLHNKSIHEEKSMHENDFEDLNIEDFLNAEFTQTSSVKTLKTDKKGEQQQQQKQITANPVIMFNRKRPRLSLEVVERQEAEMSPKKKLISTMRPNDLCSTLEMFAKDEFSTPIKNESFITKCLNRSITSNDDGPSNSGKSSRKNSKSECSLFSDESGLIDLDVDKFCQTDKKIHSSNCKLINYITIDSEVKGYSEIISKLSTFSKVSAYDLTIHFEWEVHSKAISSGIINDTEANLTWYGGPSGYEQHGGGFNSDIHLKLTKIHLAIISAGQWNLIFVLDFHRKYEWLDFWQGNRMIRCLLTREEYKYLLNSIPSFRHLFAHKDEESIKLFLTLIENSQKVITMDIKWALRIIRELFGKDHYERLSKLEADHFYSKFTSPAMLWWIIEPDSRIISKLSHLIREKFDQDEFYSSAIEYLSCLGHNSDVLVQLSTWKDFDQVNPSGKSHCNDTSGSSDSEETLATTSRRPTLRPTITDLWQLGINSKENPYPIHLLDRSTGDQTQSDFNTINPLICCLIGRLTKDLELLPNMPLSSINLEVETLWNIGLMEAHGFAFKIDVLLRCRQRLNKSMKVIEDVCEKLVGMKFDLGSPAAVSDILYNKLRLPNPLETSKSTRKISQAYQASMRAQNNFLLFKSAKELNSITTTGETKRAHSTAKDQLLLMAHLHPLPLLIVEWRHIKGLMEHSFNGIISECEKFVKRNEDHKFYRISCNYDNYTATGRLVSINPNLQSVPKNFSVDWLKLRKRPRPSSILMKNAKLTPNESVDWPDIFKTILDSKMPVEETMFKPRSAFTTRDPNRYCLIGVDFSQLELRILAHMSRDAELHHLLNDPASKKDAFKLASHWFKKSSTTEVSDEERGQAKQLCYGLIYGMTPYTIAGELKIDLSEAEALITSFLEAFPSLSTFITSVIEKAKENGYVRTINGRYRQLDPFKRLLKGETVKPSELQRAERQAINSTIQGSAADISKKALNIVMKKFSQSSQHTVQIFPVLHIHDEIIFEISPKEKADELADQISETMSSTSHVFNMRIPLPVKFKVGDNWDRLK